MDIPKLTPLCEIAYKYGTDKCPQIKHYYTQYYWGLFKDRRNSVKKVLEMGIGKYEDMKHVDAVFDPILNRHYEKGASLKMWKEFFPKAHIYGADNAPETMFKERRITTILCDETKEKDIKALVKKTGSDIDIFIDDGSHKMEHQIYLCKTILPLLRKDVVYIIEDVAFPNHIKTALSQYHIHTARIPSKFKKSRLLVVRNV